MVEMAKPIFTIMKGGADEEKFNPFETIDILSEETRRFLHIRANNIVKTYTANGDETKTNHYSRLVECS